MANYIGTNVSQLVVLLWLFRLRAADTVSRGHSLRMGERGYSGCAEYFLGEWIKRSTTARVRKRSLKKMRNIAGIALAAVAIELAPEIRAQEQPFYQGKTIKIVVGFTSGGFYDRWSRLLA